MCVCRTKDLDSISALLAAGAGVLTCLPNARDRARAAESARIPEEEGGRCLRHCQVKKGEIR